MVAQLDATFWEGIAVVVLAFVLFGGGIMVITGAVFGNRMAYLVTATSFFAFMIILSALWTFGAPGTPALLGPKGDLPAWVAAGAGRDLSSPTISQVAEYPGGPWQQAEDAGLAAEVEPATLSFQEFLAEEATSELRAAGQEVEVTAEEFRIQNLLFTEVDGTELAAATAVAQSGGPEVEVVGYKDPGNEGVPSYLFLAGSIIGFVIHLPFLDRAERRRKEILTGGDQTPWRGPA